MTALGLIGDPVEQSISPAIYQAAFAACGLAWEYRLLPVAQGELATVWPKLAQQFRGLNVTMPHKEAVALLADHLSVVAKLGGSVNMLTFEKGEVLGDSTDGAGFLAALNRQESSLPQIAVLLGTGGAARAVALALAQAGVAVRVVGRNQQAGVLLAQALTLPGLGQVTYWGFRMEMLQAALADASLLVNATPLGSYQQPQLSPLPPGVKLSSSLVVFDLVYRPRPTPLLQVALKAGCRTIAGVEMLVEQAVLSFRGWTGQPAPVAAMRAAAEIALGGEHESR